ncbi:hypothetical protein M3J07_012526 [Ascochyta lentis]
MSLPITRICTHLDIRQCDGFQCCFACGAVLPEHPRLQPTISALPFYVYSGLDTAKGQQIRLVLLCPGTFTDTIRCTIECVDLEDHPHFDAVSYTWATEAGDNTRSPDICIDDEYRIHVTKNCEAALRHLRRPDCARKLWIDSISINQYDTKERGHQVGFMGRIYESASTVQICINDPDNAYTNCMRWLNLDHGQSFSLDLVHEELKQLFQKRYFERAWVLQEVALAKIAVLVVNGESVTLSPPQLTRLIRGCREWRLVMPGPLNWTRAGSRQLSIGIVSWLRISWYTSCQDPRDKIYAILSLLSPEIRDLIPVDYSVSFETVIIRAIIACIADSRNLDVLSYARLPEDEDVVHSCNFRIADFDRFLQLATTAVDTLCPTSQILRRSRVHIAVDDVPEDMCYHGSVASSAITMIYKPNLSTQLLPLFKVRSHLIDISLGTVHYRAYENLFALSNNYVTSFSHNGEWIGPRFRRTNPNKTRIAGTVQEASKSVLNQSKQTATSYPPSYLSGNGASNEGVQQMLPGLEDTPDYLTGEHPGLIAELFLLSPNYTSASEDYNQSDLQAFARSACSFASRAEGYRSKPFRPDPFNKPEAYKLFYTNYSIGVCTSWSTQNDAVYGLDGTDSLFLLRQVSPGVFRIVEPCYLWAAWELDYWNPGTRKGIWYDRPCDLGAEQTRMIEIY